MLESPWNAPNKDCWVWTVDPLEAPDQPEQVTVTVEKGCGGGKRRTLKSVPVPEKLNALGAKHGVGRIDIVENRLVGIKSRGCYETPGGTIMVNALRAIEQLVLDRDSFKWREQLGPEMSYVVYDGRWFAPLRKSLQAAAESLAAEVNGEVVLQLYKGRSRRFRKIRQQPLFRRIRHLRRR